MDGKGEATSQRFIYSRIDVGKKTVKRQLFLHFVTKVENAWSE